ncbi:hypothetical protein CF326_g6780 [Tilletia indica]|nr:hypothetical protein CF326_g6780 [Tilletia indica]
MAPELAKAEPYTIKVNLFSLEITLVEFITGNLHYGKGRPDDVKNGTVRPPKDFDTLRTSLKAMLLALSKRDCHLPKLKVEEHKADLKSSQEEERAALEQLTQVKLEAKRARKKLFLQIGITRCDNKDDVLDRIKALVSSPAASRDREFTSTSSSSERTTRATRHTVLSRFVVISALRTLFNSLRIASKLPDATFSQADLVEHAKEFGLLPLETGVEYVAAILTSNKDEWESRGKSWKLRN